MIVDASAILAIYLDEEGGQIFSDRISESTSRCIISPVNYLECCLRIDRMGDPVRADRFDETLGVMGVEIGSVGREEALLARQAYQRYGKGNHPARLNLGDCFAYALSKARGEPLLYKGGDFARTDVEAAI